MTVRDAGEADLARVFEMGVSFLVSAPDYAAVVQWTPEKVEELTRWLTLVETNRVFVLEGADGAIVGMLAIALTPNLWGDGSIAEEVAWWVEPGHRGGAGLKLLGAGEEWARQQGALVLRMVAPRGSQIGTVYERRGYVPLESIYVLRLQNGPVLPRHRQKEASPSPAPAGAAADSVGARDDGGEPGD
jgi:GNAT superfamily N-acetyltransferase